MAERTFTFHCTFIAFVVILTGIEGLKCRLENDSKSVEEFENMVRICLRSSISPQDKSKNKQSWNNNNRDSNNNKKPNTGMFGKDSEEEEEEDDYDDNYGEEPKNNTGTEKKNQSKTMQNNKRKSNSKNVNGGGGTRFRRSPQYSNGGYSSREYDTNYGEEARYPMNSMMQRKDLEGYVGFGYRDNRGNNNERMGDNNYNMRGNSGYNTMGGHGNNIPGRYRRYAQYSSGNNWNDGGYNNQNGQRNRQGEYGNRGNSRENYGISGRPDGYNSGSSNGGNGNNRGSPNGGFGNNGGYGNPYTSGGNGGKGGGYGLYDNRGSSANYSPGNNRNSSKGLKKQQSSPLNNVKPLDEDSTPDKAAVMAVMTKNIKERELNEFIQDSINECFDNMESDDTDGKCDMSKSLMICLEEKGKQNCEDWESAGPSTNPDKWFSNSNNRPTNQQRPPAWG